MPVDEKDLGKLVGSYSLSAAVLQRAVIVAAVSFAFFLIMLVAFYVRGHFGYFALSTAFLAVYIFTLVGWVIRRRSVVGIYENGIRHGNFRAAWHEIQTVSADKNGLQLINDRNEKTIVPLSINGFESILLTVKQGIERRSQ